MKKQRDNSKPRLRLDPKLMRITAEEIRADLIYPVGAGSRVPAR